MYEMSITECQRRRGILGEIRKELEADGAADFNCQCHQRARASQPQLLERFIAGDNEVVESILGFYQSCIDAWAKDIYNDPVYESHFKAEIAARFIQECVHFENATICHRLKLISCEVADAHLQHIEAHHASQETSAEGSLKIAPHIQRAAI